MRKTVFVMLAMALVPFGAFAVDGVVLINQSTVMAAGGFPYTITQAGSYKLSGNLTVPDANTTAIRVTADNVTIDLNGFGIFGPTVCVGTPVTSCSPVSTSPPGGFGVDGGQNRSITVVNGSVRGMGVHGILLGDGAYVEKVHVESNAVSGILFPLSGTAIGNTAMGNGFAGINGGTAGLVVSGNRSIGNKMYGIIVICPSVVLGNIAMSNGFNVFTSGPNNCQIVNNAP